MPQPIQPYKPGSTVTLHGSQQPSSAVGDRNTSYYALYEASYADVTSRLQNQGGDLVGSSETRTINHDQIISNKDYNNDDFTKFISLFSLESQQEASSEKLTRIKKSSDDGILTCLLENKDQLEQTIKESDNLNLRDSIEFLIKGLEEKGDYSTQIIYCSISNNLELKQYMNEMFGEYFSSKQDISQSITDTKFKGLLYTFHCADDTENQFDILSAIVLSLYNKANEVQKKILVSFMELSQNVMSNANATIPCKLKLLLEVLSLIEYKTDCEQEIKELTNAFSYSIEDAYDGMPGEKDNKELVQLFYDKRLTVAQHNIRPMTQAIVAKPQQELVPQLPVYDFCSGSVSVAIQNQKPIASFNRPFSLLSTGCQQAASPEQRSQIKQDLDKKVMKRLLDKVPELKKFSTGESSVKFFAKSLCDILKGNDDVSIKLKYVPISPEFKFLFVDQIADDIIFPIGEAYETGPACIPSNTQVESLQKDTASDAKFSAALFLLHCLHKETAIISAISLYLYKKADSQHALVIIEFLKLAIDIIDCAHADIDCKINQLIEVSSLIENNINCIQGIKDLTQVVYTDTIDDGIVFKEDNQYFIDLFQHFNLTAAQHNITATTQSSSFQQQESNQEIQGAASNAIDRRLVEQLKRKQEELNYPDDTHNLYPNNFIINQNTIIAQPSD